MALSPLECNVAVKHGGLRTDDVTGISSLFIPTISKTPIKILHTHTLRSIASNLVRSMSQLKHSVNDCPHCRLKKIAEEC